LSTFSNVRLFFSSSKQLTDKGKSKEPVTGGLISGLGLGLGL